MIDHNGQEIQPLSFRQEALVANLWVILATIVSSAALTIPFADTGKVEYCVGFGIYFVANILALYLASRGLLRTALLTYMSQTYLCTADGMILLNEQPAHMVLAMANFVLLYAVVLGGRAAVLVTATMVAVFTLIRVAGEMVREWMLSFAAHTDLASHYDERVAFVSLITTSFSTGYLITTTISLQDRAHKALSKAHSDLSLAKRDLEQRHDRMEILSELGATAAAASSVKELTAAALSAFSLGIPDKLCILAEPSHDDAYVYALAQRGPREHFLFRERLTRDEDNFAHAVTAIVGGAYARIEGERRTRLAERLEGVERLAASVAHDFNNLLTPIAAAQELTTNTETFRYSQQILANAAKSATSQARALVKKLTLHTHTKEHSPTVIDFDEILRESQALLISFVTGEISLAIVPCGEPVWVYANRIELEQVILNLVLNALAAVGEHGNVTVQLCQNQSSARLKIVDDGPGIPEHMRDWVLQPFNTTKEDGSGLGLSTVTRVAKSVGGELSIGDRVPRGIEVTFTLPKVGRPTSRKDQKPPHQAFVGPIRVLIVEDDERIQLILKEMLGNLGHTSVAVSDGLKALSMLETDANFDLIITDYQMPGLNGAQLIERLRQRGDTREVILLTGYGSIVSDKLTTPPSAFLAKPLQTQELEHTLGQIFSKASA